MKILNITQKTVLAEHAQMADTPLSRMTGLLNKKSLNPGEALIITRCQSIHMFFMRFAIDVVFVDKDWIVVGIVSAIKPFRLSPLFLSARAAIEGPVGMIAQSRTQRGDRLSIE